MDKYLEKRVMETQWCGTDLLLDGTGQGGWRFEAGGLCGTSRASAWGKCVLGAILKNSSTYRKDVDDNFSKIFCSWHRLSRARVDTKSSHVRATRATDSLPLKCFLDYDKGALERDTEGKLRWHRKWLVLLTYSTRRRPNFSKCDQHTQTGSSVYGDGRWLGKPALPSQTSG